MNIMDMRMDNLEKGKENRQAISRHFPSDAGTDVSSASTEIPGTVLMLAHKLILHIHRL